MISSFSLNIPFVEMGHESYSLTMDACSMDQSLNRSLINTNIT